MLLKHQLVDFSLLMYSEVDYPLPVLNNQVKVCVVCVLTSMPSM